MIKHENNFLSIRKKCFLLDVNRSQIYYKKNMDNSINEQVKNEIYNVFEKYPFFGYRRIHAVLQRSGYKVNRKRVQCIMKREKIKAIYPKKNLSIKNKEHKIYPYLLKNLDINKPNDVWQTDITYIKINTGFLYLAGIIDIFSRKIIGWHTSPFLDTKLCIQTLENAIIEGKPEILNSDQGCQFTSNLWIESLKKKNIKISMDGKGRWADNVYIERFWRSLKYESIFLNSFENMKQAQKAITEYINFYNDLRPHQSLNYKTPNEVYKKIKGKKCNYFSPNKLPLKGDFKNSHKDVYIWS